MLDTAHSGPQQHIFDTANSGTQQQVLSTDRHHGIQARQGEWYFYKLCRGALDIFGGPYSLERFRSISRQPCTATIISPPYVSTYMVTEERDASTSETCKVSSLGLNGISTVRGLRRPAVPISLISREIPDVCPYHDFLRSKGVAVEASTGAPTDDAGGASTSAPSEEKMVVEEPQGVKPARKAETKPTKPTRGKDAAKGTLARFMQ